MLVGAFLHLINLVMSLLSEDSRLDLWLLNIAWLIISIDKGAVYNLIQKSAAKDVGVQMSYEKT